MRKILSVAIAILPGALFAQMWSNVGLGTNEAVTSFSVDANQTNLFVGGHFSNAGTVTVGKLANWDGGNWTDLGADMDYPVHAVLSENGKLYVGGEFISAGGGVANRIAVYENGVWTTLGNGLPASVNKIISYNNEIYAGTLSGLYKWNGSSWTNMGLTDNTYAVVTDLEVFQGDLYAVGSFDQAGGTNVNGIAKWNGTTWSGIGTGSNDLIDAIEVWNNELFIGGVFTAINGVSAGGFAKWNGTVIEAVGSGVPSITVGFPYRVSAMEVYLGDLYLGGLFLSIDGVNASNVAKYNGTAFSSVGAGTNDAVYAMHEFQGELYFGGRFTQAGGQSASYIAKWSGVAGVTESDNSGVKIYPVPVIDLLTVDLGETIVNEYSVQTISGRVISKGNRTQTGKLEISLEGQSEGVYFVTLMTSTGIEVKRKFIKVN